MVVSEAQGIARSYEVMERFEKELSRYDALMGELRSVLSPILFDGPEKVEDPTHEAAYSELERAIQRLELLNDSLSSVRSRVRL